jgi:hypothetical protein
MSRTPTVAGSYGPQTRRNLFLPDALLADLKELASKKQISYSELIRQILTKAIHHG